MFKIVSYRVMIHVYSGIWKKKVLTCRESDVFAVGDVVVINRTFPGSSPANSDVGFRILNKGVHFP